MLLRSLNSYALTHGGDIDDAVTVGDVVLSRSDLLGAATSVAERIMGVDRIAVLAEPTARTVVAVVGALIAGVAVVPVPPDSGPTEIDHILGDSGARGWLGVAPDHDGGLPSFRSACTRAPGTATRSRPRTRPVSCSTPRAPRGRRRA